MEEKPKKKEFLSWVSCLALALVFALAVRFFIAEPITVVGDSMNPTYHDGDLLLGNKLFRHIGGIESGLIKKGDIVIIKIDGEPLLIKRLIATEGDTVSVSGGKLFLNGEALTEPYLGEAIAYEMEEIVIPEGHCFILGDNRNISHDSHIFGPVPVSAVYASKKSK
ncbi:MAG: signal peptidase I [Christensenellaceae bacterium]|nr:signal peptidase I [Christensenellaceae bacterium]